MNIRRCFSLSLILATMLAVAHLGVAQQRTPIVVNKYSFAAVTKAATGTFWTTGQSALNYNSAIIRLVPGGTSVATACTARVFSGPTAALATVVADDPNNTIDCVSEKSVVVNNLGNYFNMQLDTLSGGTAPSLTVYVTLTNAVGPSETSYKPPNLLTSMASNTAAEVIAAPAAGISTFLVGIIVEKISGASATTTITTGTGTNCGTGTTTLMGPITLSAAVNAGYIPLNFKVTAAKAVCVATDAAGTGVRLVYK
jgi:hypothetical protein